MTTSSFATADEMARLTARMLLEIKAVHFRADEPYIFTSGLASPVYIDCRKLISYPRIRSTLMDFAVATLQRDAGFEAFDAMAGGETAGIPFAAWIADRLALPMQYVRKKPKGFGRDARIEGAIRDGQRVLLVEDLTTDGGSQGLVRRCPARGRRDSLGNPGGVLLRHLQGDAGEARRGGAASALSGHLVGCACRKPTCRAVRRRVPWPRWKPSCRHRWTGLRHMAANTGRIDDE